MNPSIQTTKMSDPDPRCSGLIGDCKSNKQHLSDPKGRSAGRQSLDIVLKLQDVLPTWLQVQTLQQQMLIGVCFGSKMSVLSVLLPVTLLIVGVQNNTFHSHNCCTIQKKKLWMYILDGPSPGDMLLKQVSFA